VLALLLVVSSVLGACASAPTTRASVEEAAPTATVTPSTITTTSGVFTGTVVPVTAADLPASWREGCPVGPQDLRLLQLTYRGFDGGSHPGSMVVHAAVSRAVVDVFRRLYEQGFPIRRMEPVDVFGGSDEASIAADNTSGFNCRDTVSIGPRRWSQHAYGRAIDVNPVENPYVLGGRVLPPAGAAYLDRSDRRPGMALPGGPLTAAFAAAGWSWGGEWAAPDYQHFSESGN